MCWCNYAAEVQTWYGMSWSNNQLGVFSGMAVGPIPEIYTDPDFGMCEIRLDLNHAVNYGEPLSHKIMYYNGPYFDSDYPFDTIATYAIGGKASIIGSNYGNGRVFLTGPHPEWEEDDSRDGVSYFDSFDDDGSEWNMMKNAVNWCLRL
ncbi:MAG: hypothetical protein JXR48_03825 [Candidatus Delongbacteria bacterium]|nr:hypothetical protein [Candidatus Delongbacteria bacterium]MBN2834075.1 hypothetical protein [Candidatus Delongbacteria bacterium]